MPQQVGMSEAVGRTLEAMVRCMLAGSGLSKFLWGEFMFTAAFLGNRTPHSAIGIQSPYKMLHGTEPDLKLLRVIVPRSLRRIDTYFKKLQLKAMEGRLVGYSNNSKSYRAYNPVTGRIMESRNVIFMETPSRHRWKKLRGRFIRQATAWTTTTTSQATTFCAVFTITFPCWNRFPGRLLTTSSWTGFQTFRQWLSSWRGSTVTRRDTLDRGAAGPP